MDFNCVTTPTWKKLICVHHWIQAWNIRVLPLMYRNLIAHIITNITINKTFKLHIIIHINFVICHDDNASN